MDKQQIETQGHRALVAEHCALTERVAQMEERLAQLEYLLSEEIMRSLLSEPGARLSAADATSMPYPCAVMAGVTADSWQNGGWVTQYAAAVE